MRRAALSLLWVPALLLLATPALAHTEFESSTPANQEVVDDPVSDITVKFTLPVTIVGNGFEVLDPRGNIISPEVESGDDTVFTLILEEPLAGGEVGVRYEVQAEDGHVLAGGFSFTVAASTPTTTATAASTTTEERSTTTAVNDNPTSTISTTTSAPADGDDGNSTTPLLIGLGVVLVGGAGIYAGMRSRS